MRNFLGIELAEVFQVRNTHLSRCQKLYQLGVKILSCMGKTNNKGNANNIELQKIQLINSFEFIRIRIRIRKFENLLFKYSKSTSIVTIHDLDSISC